MDGLSILIPTVTFGWGIF